jgi:toxin FitB
VYVLDTDVLSELSKPRRNRHKNFEAWRETVSLTDFYISVCTIMEWRKGLERNKSKLTAEEFKKFEQSKKEFLDSFGDRILAANRDVAEAWGVLMGRSDKDFADKLIAATAECHGYTVATRNEDNFKNFDVEHINPFKFKKK